MKHFLKALCLAACTFLLASCTDENQNTAQGKPAGNTYFPLAAYLNRQVKMLDSTKATVQKHAIVNTQDEEKTVTGVNWQRELQQFINLDLNKPALRQSYNKDTTRNTELQQYTVKYTAQNAKLETRHLSLTFNTNGSLYGLNAHVISQNLLMDSDRFLVMNFTPQATLKNYEITSTEKIIMLAKDEVKLTGIVKN